ncbi:MAG: NAD(P)-dependent oxidoreductase [Holdemanella sp.]|nr:NAD(P)-dependent oxidoreductase [Holdemanella sp.]
MNPVLYEDVCSIYNDENIDWKQFEGKRILITGATGLIGLNLVNAFLFFNEKTDNPCTILACIRNRDKAIRLFGENDTIEYIIQDITEDLDVDCDYIIHAASMTSSKDFMYKPVETIDIAIKGTQNVLNLSRKYNVKKMVYLSSMEIYGHPEKGHEVLEEEVAGFDIHNPRNSYPVSKILCESMAVSMAKEYGVNACILRLTQTFGYGVPYEDGRVFAQFMRSAMERKDIILKTKGETERCYLYTADAIRAIITLLLKGQPGQAYTGANPETYCSIADMAKLVCREIANDEIKVIFELDDITKYGYADTLYMKLNVDKLMNLGWKPIFSLKDMFKRMIDSQNEI